MPRTKLELRTLDRLAITDERPFLRLPIYRDLKAIVAASRYRFRVMRAPNWDRALVLNLAFWTGEGDILPAPELPADVVTHVAWHLLAARALSAKAGPQPAFAMFLGESIASAFDLYLVGSLLRAGKPSAFLTTQVSALAEAASNAGLRAKGFEALLADVAKDPAGAFSELRALLMDATCALHDAPDADAAATALDALDGHRFAPLLHHYELSTWVLHARVHGKGKPTKAQRAVDSALRSPAALDWLTHQWVLPAAARAV